MSQYLRRKKTSCLASVQSNAFFNMIDLPVVSVFNVYVSSFFQNCKEMSVKRGKCYCFHKNINKHNIPSKAAKFLAARKRLSPTLLILSIPIG